MSGALDVLSRLTPQMRAVLDKQNELATDAFATNVGFEELRLNYVKERAFWNEGGPEMAKSIDDVVHGPAGEIPIRSHYPKQTDGGSCLLYLHGGGFVVGNLDTHDRIMRALADLTGAVVVGVDYSLSPEAKFPQAIHEVAAVVRHLADNAQAFGIDGKRFSFAGDSGGAALSFGSMLYLRDEGGPAISCLLLYYGMFGLLDSPSRRMYGGEWDGLTKADMDYYFSCYTTSPRDWESPYLDGLSADLSFGVPPCYIVGAELDPILDDSTALATILTERGVRNELEVFDGVLHAFLHHSRMLPEAVEALEHGAAFYRDVIQGADKA